MSDKIIKQLIQTMEDAVASFQDGIPDVQRGLLDQINEQLKDLQLQNGKVLNNVQNLKLINGLKNKLERFIISEGYKEKVKKFIEVFNNVEALNRQYFADFNLKFEPSKTIPIIKEMTVDKTLNDLLDQGLQSNIVDKIHDILSQNVTTGSSYASLTEQLRNHILTNDIGEGSLERYTKTITTDAINQYSAQYHDTLAQDLPQMNWLRYVGSNIKTTREFCELLSKKEWVQRSELDSVIHGDIDGHSCKLSKSTGLPLGMIPGTNVDNFKIRRGGYNCGHQAFWVPDSAVPDNIKGNVVPKQEKEFIPAKTIEEANDFLKQKHGITYMKPSREDLNLTTKNKINERLDYLLSTYKKEEFKKIGFTRNAHTYAETNGISLDFNPSIFNTSKIGELFNKDVSSGYHFKSDTTPEQSVIDHEFAHILTHKLLKKGAGESPFQKELYAIQKDYAKELVGFAKAGNKYIDSPDFISSYAHTSYEEFTAEAFSMSLNSKKPSKYALKVKDLIDKYFKL